MNGIMLNDNHDLQIDIRKNAEGLIVQGLVIGNIRYQKDDIDFTEIEAGRTKEISLFPYRVNNQVRIRGIIG